MTKRAVMLLLSAALLLVCALSTRGGLFWLFFWVISLMFLVGLISALWTRATLRVGCALDAEQVDRGGSVVLDIDIRHACPLPVAALQLNVFALRGVGSFPLFAPVKPLVVNALAYGLSCPHVGLFRAGVSSVRVQDVFGLFSFVKKLPSQTEDLAVLPNIYLTRSLAFSPGDSDNESAMARAFEDATMPTDLRAFQQGDELKKVHWKLSMRRKELLVRVYDQPMKPDALLLIDCAPPETIVGAAADVRDAICEAAASLASVALADGAPVRMPLLAEEPIDISATRPEDIAAVRDALARCAFDGTQQFERVLLLETRRMRRTGSTAVVTSRINPVIADMLLRIRRMGPRVRVLLAADGRDETVRLLTGRLMRNDVEVEIIEMDGHVPLEEEAG